VRRLAAVLLAAGLVLAACGDDAADDTETVADPPAAEGGTGECPPAEKPEEAPTSFDAAPADCLEDGVDYGAVVTTSEGSFTIDLLEDDAPITVNNFVALARWGWFDGDDFHRIVPGFVNQAGDPVGNPPGTGGPGYEIPDELPAAVSDYPPGAVAMANRGPDTGGSQWFVCVDCSQLPTPGYSLFGQVTEGQDVVEAINTKPSGGVRIEAVEITEA
jgi:cyclophilin family peptidyl-prolyl cis-trans isomerase